MYMVSGYLDYISGKTLNMSWKELWPGAYFPENLRDEPSVGNNRDGYTVSDGELQKLIGHSKANIQNISKRMQTQCHTLQDQLHNMIMYFSQTTSAE